jgi:hypothetical protein
LGGKYFGKENRLWRKCVFLGGGGKWVFGGNGFGKNWSFRGNGGLGGKCGFGRKSVVLKILGFVRKIGE